MAFTSAVLGHELGSGSHPRAGAGKSGAAICGRAGAGERLLVLTRTLPYLWLISSPLRWNFSVTQPLAKGNPCLDGCAYRGRGGTASGGQTALSRGDIRMRVTRSFPIEVSLNGKPRFCVRRSGAGDFQPRHLFLPITVLTPVPT